MRRRNTAQGERGGCGAGRRQLGAVHARPRRRWRARRSAATKKKFLEIFSTLIFLGFVKLARQTTKLATTCSAATMVFTVGALTFEHSNGDDDLRAQRRGRAGGHGGTARPDASAAARPSRQSRRHGVVALVTGARGSRVRGGEREQAAAEARRGGVGGERM